MAEPTDFSKEFPLDEGIFTTAKLTLGASTDANAAQAILSNEKFPAGDIELGHISFSAETGTVSLKPVGGTSVTFDIAASAQSGVGVYGKFADAMKALNLTDSPALKIVDELGQRYLLMDWGYEASLSGSASQPLGLLGAVSFGVDAKRHSVFAIIHRFNANQGSRQVIEDAIASWRLPRQVAYVEGDVNLKPGTWLLAEADGSLAFKLGTSLGWNMSFVKDAKLLGITHNLSAKIDASLTAALGFSVSGKYILVVGRENTGTVVRLRLYKQSSKGLDFGLNLNVGAQVADTQIPTNFDDFIKSLFGVHGLQVLQDLREWTDPSTDIGQKLAGLADQTALDLLKEATDVDPAAEFDKAKQIVANALNTWTGLPEKLSSMLWSFMDKAGPSVAEDFKAFITGLANPKTAAATVATTLQKVTFGDTPQGQFLEAIADKGLLTLANDLRPVSKAAEGVLDILNGGIIAKLQAFINQRLDLNQIRNAATDADPSRIDQWLRNRLGNFLDKALGLGDLRDIRKAIQTLDDKVGDYYKTAVHALTSHYRVNFAATYEKTTSDNALIDVEFDLSKPTAAALFSDVVAKSNLDELLTRETSGVTLNQATLTHEIRRKAMVELHMPLFDFSSTHVNDAMVSLAAEDEGGRLLVYQIDAQDKVVTANNRAASQLSILASLKAGPGQVPQLASDGSIAYEMRLVKADMRPIDLEARTTAFIREYLGTLFGGGDSSIRSFYTDLDGALTVATHNQSNHLGDMAVAMQLSLPASVLAGWFQLRDASHLRADRMHLSRTLQAAWRNLLPSLYFQHLSQYQFNESVAALLVWASLPVSTSIQFDDPTIEKFNTDKDVYWDYPDVDLQRAVACDRATIVSLAARLSGIQSQLIEAGSTNAGFFAPSQAGRFVEMALNRVGDRLLYSLLSTEARLVGKATDALKQVSDALAAAPLSPTRAISIFSSFAAEITETFNTNVTSVYSGMSDRSVGPMLLVEASAALGSPGTRPGATLTMYALKRPHTFNLSSFAEGEIPPSAEVALIQTLVSVG